MKGVRLLFKKKLAVLGFIPFCYALNACLVQKTIKSKEAFISVHRGGGEEKGRPENCIESFTYYAKKYPVYIECDVRKTKDDTLVLLHDYKLDRTTTAKGPIDAQSWTSLKSLRLKDNLGNLTDYKIPKLSQALTWAKKNGIILMLDIKTGVSYEEVIQTVENFQAEKNTIIITYSYKEASLAHAINENLMLSVGIMRLEDYTALHNLGIPDSKMIAFTGTREPKEEVISFLDKKNILSILGTLGNLDKKAISSSENLYQKWKTLGIDIFATDYPNTVYEKINTSPTLP